MALRNFGYSAILWRGETMYYGQRQMAIVRVTSPYARTVAGGVPVGSVPFLQAMGVKVKHPLSDHPQAIGCSTSHFRPGNDFYEKTELDPKAIELLAMHGNELSKFILPSHNPFQIIIDIKEYVEAADKS